MAAPSARVLQVAKVLSWRHGALGGRKWDVDTLTLARMQLPPCVGCWMKTPGECATNDDGREIVKAVARCDVPISGSAVIHGGQSLEEQRAEISNLILKLEVRT